MMAPRGVAHRRAQPHAMFFLDSTGVFSLICLMIQCGMAWLFAAFFAVLAARRAPWLRSWSGAYLGLGIGLTALCVRFVLAHHHAAGDWTLKEGSPEVRAFYGLYVAGKVLFAWCFLAGASRLRGAPWPRGLRWPAAAVVVGAAVGSSAPSIESLLLFQALWVPVVFLRAARLLTPRGEDSPGWGRVVPRTLVLWSGVWLLYGVSVSIAGPFQPQPVLPWTILLRVNSLIDLAFQAVLAAGLIVVVMSEAQRAVVAALRERDRLRDQLQRDEKVRALSTLVSGVAHEINNPLTAILGFADELVDGDAGVRQRAAAIVLEQAERCRGIVQRMSLLGGSSALTVGAIDVDALVHRVARGFAPQSAQARVRIVAEVAPRLPPLHADSTACEQLLANLIGNALQASPAGGVVTVRASATAAGLRLVVADQGPGVPAADRSRIFEPFWTTKKHGHGTGLGLAIVDAIVHSHDGTIEVGDAPGGGAQFTVEMPWSRDASTATPLPATPSLPPKHGSGLLVIDDEPLVRAMIERQATAEGWRVVAVASAAAALELLARDGERIDAIVCDLRMPGLSGQSFHDRLAADAPHWLTRIVFITGDLTSNDATLFAQRCRAPIVSKPFVARELLQRVRALLASTRAG